MLSFNNDYSEGAHPAVLDLLVRTNLDVHTGYGLDALSVETHARIRALVGCPDAQVHLLTGGTSANLIALTAFMRPFEAAVCAESGHINGHETGALEAAGHKILTVPSVHGKPLPEDVRALCALHADEHVTRPRVLFISNATEVGTVYTRAELAALRQTCDACGLLLYLDGARLGSALACPENDVSFTDLPRYCDAFYIGGTKNGALLGEAMVLVNPALFDGFRHVIKQRGGMLAKGRVVAAQFSALLQDGLYLENARHANRMADILREGLQRAGIPLFEKTATNQVFPILSDDQCARLRETIAFQDWARVDATHRAVRFVTSWATREADAREAAAALRALV
jgi:threonine aldolase